MTVSIAIPGDLQAWLDEEVELCGFKSAEAYMLALLRGHKRHIEDQLENLLLEAVESGPSIVVDEKYWARKRARLVKSQNSARAR